MIPVLSREQSRKLDALAIDECAVPGVTLMENAGRGAASVIAELCAPDARALVLCGAGNNGGDGYVVARRLHTLGIPVTVVSVVDPAKLKGDALTNYRAWTGLGQPVLLSRSADEASVVEHELDALRLGDVVVDALFGTGLDRPIEGHLAQIITRLGTVPARCVALDIPSGLCANTGAVLGVAVRADVTVTFAQRKLGLYTSAGARHAGRIAVADIGIPESMVERAGHSAQILEARDLRGWLSPRAADAHKRSAGHVLCFAGRAGTSGAALLCARGALRAGAGLVTLAGFDDTLALLAPRVLEEMTAPLDEQRLDESVGALLQRCDSVVIGPGFGSDERAARVLRAVLAQATQPVVLDADAITLLAGWKGEQRLGATRVLTPHPGELGRLLGVSTATVEADRFAAVQEAADRTHAIVVLKGPCTLIAENDSTVWINDGAAPALATAGSGDVLSGALGAFMARHEPRRAAALAVDLHARSGQRWQREHRADRGMLAREIADGLVGALADLAPLESPLPL